MNLLSHKLNGTIKLLTLCCSLLLFSSCDNSKKSTSNDILENEEVRKPVILHSYPKYEEIRVKFLETYSFQQYNGLPTIVDFEKRPDGYYVVLKNFQDGSFETVFHELFWEHSNDKYVKLDLQEVRSPDDNSSTISAPISNAAFYYDICPYYGYPGWELELINACSEHYSKFSDTLLYALATAHSSYANGFVFPGQYGIMDDGRAYELPMTPNALAPEQLDEYLGYIHKGLELYDRVALSNPGFNTIVGTISIKAANERMDAFNHLLILQDEFEARKLLKPDLYPDYVIELSEQILESCPKNALLFTAGDNDTYPLWYVQSQYNFRSDVKVINKSLLNIERYALQLKAGDKGSPIVNTSFTPGQLDSIGVVYLDDNINTYSSLTIPALFTKIKAAPFEPSLNPLSSSSLRTIKSSKSLIFENVSPPVDLSIAPFSGPTSFTINWGNDYMTRGELVALDVINQFINERPICFTYDYSRSALYFMNDHLVQYGYVDILYPNSNLSGGFSEESVEKTYSTFIRPRLNTTERTASTEDERKWSIWTRNLYLDVTQALLAADQTVKALSTIESSFKLFPIGPYPFDYYHVVGIKYLLYLGEKERATQYIHAALANLEKTHIEFKDKKNVIGTYDANSFNYNCTELRDIISYYYSDETSASWISQLEAML
jgi:hypothetical protein